MFFWTCALQNAVKLERVRSAEQKLLNIAKSYASRPSDSWELTTFDTQIPRSVVPLKAVRERSTRNGGETDDTENNKTLVIHGVHVTSKQESNLPIMTDTPLVLLHGYMNAGMLVALVEIDVPYSGFFLTKCFQLF